MNKKKSFCIEYNLHFFVPKKDHCDLCEEIKIKLQEGKSLEAEQKDLFDIHVQEKNATRMEKK